MGIVYEHPKNWTEVAWNRYAHEVIEMESIAEENWGIEWMLYAYELMMNEAAEKLGGMDLSDFKIPIDAEIGEKWRT